MRPHVIGAFVLAALPFAGMQAAEPPDDQGRGRAQRAERRQMRFQAMDTNRDGVITRAEWRGSDRSFQVHDWNGDGRLAGDEVEIDADRRVQDEPGVEPDDRRFHDWTAAGFTNLDHNRDGRIDRSEWHHDFESFRRADRNRDDILTRREFLGGDGIDIDREDRFEYLDANNDGRVDRGEWHASRDAFNWLDRNNDGVLSRQEVVGDEAEQPVGTSGKIVIVDARQRWVDTGIDVRPGDRVSLSAEGRVQMSPNADDYASPAGSETGRRASNAPLPDQPAGALIARVGTFGPIFVGTRETLAGVNASGRLYLGVNDDHLPDNAGQYRVTVTIRR